MRKTLIYFLKLMVLMSAFSLISIAYASIDDSGARVDWDYSGDEGPHYWGHLDKRFIACSQGKWQSPIDIPANVEKKNSQLDIQYQTSPLIVSDEMPTEVTIGDTQTIYDDGHGLKVSFPQNAREFIKFDGKEYRLVQFHTHSPSENHIQGKSYPGEIHFVHQGKDGKLAVIAVFIKPGAPNPTLQKIINNAPDEEGKEFIIKGQSINPNDLIPTNRSHYVFSGSLTTPPCSEGVQWIVMSEPITASSDQIRRLRSLADGPNARPVQPFNDRPISFSPG